MVIVTNAKTDLSHGQRGGKGGSIHALTRQQARNWTPVEKSLNEVGSRIKPVVQMAGTTSSVASSYRNVFVVFLEGEDVYQ